MNHESPVTSYQSEFNSPPLVGGVRGGVNWQPATPTYPPPSRGRNYAQLLKTLCIIICLLLIAIPAWAQKAGRKLNIISGEVSAVSKDFIAVVYRSDEVKGSEEEIALPVANDAVVEHKQSLSQIGIGDLVDVEYEEYSEETPDGPRSKRVAVAVRFLRAAPKQAEPFTFEVEEEETEE